MKRKIPGIHATLDLAGGIKLGPDTEYIDNITDYNIHETKKELFYLAAKELFPFITQAQLIPDMAGIRPKIQGPDDVEVKDFYIQEETERGFPGFLNLLGIESPGLTSSLAIADYVRERFFPNIERFKISS